MQWGKSWYDILKIHHVYLGSSGRSVNLLWIDENIMTNKERKREQSQELCVQVAISAFKINYTCTPYPADLNYVTIYITDLHRSLF